MRNLIARLLGSLIPESQIEQAVTSSLRRAIGNADAMSALRHREANEMARTIDRRHKQIAKLEDLQDRLLDRAREDAERAARIQRRLGRIIEVFRG